MVQCFSLFTYNPNGKNALKSVSELIYVIVLPLTIFAFLGLSTFVFSSVIGVRTACDTSQMQLRAKEITHVEVIYL